MNEDRLLRAAAAGASEALRSSPQLLLRPGSVLDVDDTVSPAVVTVTVDGDSSAEVYGHALGGVPRVGSRCVVAFAPPQAVFVIDVERPWDVPWGLIGKVEKSGSPQTGITTVVDATGMTLTFDAVSGRSYKVSAHAYVFSSVAGDGIQVYITDAANNVVALGTYNSPTNGYAGTVDPWRIVAPSGTTTYKLRVLRAGGTGTVTFYADANQVASLAIEDLGPTP